MVQQGVFPFAHYPIVIGHEIAGVVEAIGEGVTELKRGARVGLSSLYSSCGHCKQCKSGDEFLCNSMEWTGLMQDGGFQQFMLARAAYVAPFLTRLLSSTLHR
jgi:D-arabinose 1-dehydrogenase-like Zn-dependent alcohol dehydrogenase